MIRLKIEYFFKGKKICIWRNCKSGNDWGTYWRFLFIEGWIKQKGPILNITRFVYPYAIMSVINKISQNGIDSEYITVNGLEFPRDLYDT